MLRRPVAAAAAAAASNNNPPVYTPTRSQPPQAPSASSPASPSANSESSSSDGTASDQPTATSTVDDPSTSTASVSEPSASPTAIPASQDISDRNVYVYAINNSGGTASVLWNDYYGNETPYIKQDDGGSYRLETFYGHVWVARTGGDGDVNAELLGYYVVNAEPTQTWTY
ncbi:hypothetical protein HK405_008455 [Cladochytrium tenue]|nr:hypothetical protein HK405_008455 [Cladochytrium tenue]